MKKYSFLILCPALLVMISCNKSEFLSVKPDESLVIAGRLDDFQAMLDEANIMNGRGSGVVPSLGETAADNSYTMGTNIFAGELSEPFYINLYTWRDNLYQDNIIRPNDWGFAYRSIFYANTVIEGLAKLNLSPADQDKFNNIKGSALFFRAHMFYQLAQVFAPPYSEASSDTDLGIPLKLNADINEPILRSTLKLTYKKIIDDLNEALSLLPGVPKYITRPSKPAVYALLARVYQTMQNYEAALQNANNCLQMKSTLLDFNPPGISNPNASFPMPLPQNNPEIIFYSILTRSNGELLSPFYCRIDSNLLASYHVNDLRKTVYARNASFYNRPGDRGFLFKGSYDRSEKLFAGLAVDEVYLIRAECYARKNDVANAMSDLNTLLKKRWKNSVVYPVFTANSGTEALNMILTERRKELLFRGLRWTDLRRLNKEGANITVTKLALNQTYSLQPNSLQYTFLIPKDVTDFNPGIPQNPR